MAEMAAIGIDRKTRNVAFAFSVLLLLVSSAKTGTSALFDLGAVTNITGIMNDDLAVASGLGRLCFAGALLAFVSSVYGIRFARIGEPAAKGAVLFGVLAIVCGIMTAITATLDGHNPLDIVLSYAIAVCGIGQVALASYAKRAAPPIS